MAIDYTALRDEITKDPLGLGYSAAGAKGNDQAVADLLNVPRPGNTFAATRASVTVNEFVAALDPGEFLSLTSLGLQQLQILLSASVLLINDSATATILSKIFQ